MMVQPLLESLLLAMVGLGVGILFAAFVTFRCDHCGESFCIVHNPLLADRWVAERGALA
jgi:hypothetical protein